MTQDLLYSKTYIINRYVLTASSSFMIAGINQDRASITIYNEGPQVAYTSNKQDTFANLSIAIPPGAVLEIDDYLGEVWLSMLGGLTTFVTVTEIVKENG